MRNTGSAVAMVTNWLFVYVVVLVRCLSVHHSFSKSVDLTSFKITPDGIANIGWKFYMMFGIINFCFLPLIWYFFVETAGLSLEEIDRLFEIKYDNPGMSYKEATKLAQAEFAHLVHGGDSKKYAEKEGQYTAAVEDVTSDGSK
jgi:hypothetical protein